MDELKTTSPHLEKDFGKTRDGQKMVLSVTARLSKTCGLRDSEIVTFTATVSSHAGHVSYMLTA